MLKCPVFGFSCILLCVDSSRGAEVGVSGLTLDRYTCKLSLTPAFVSMLSPPPCAVWYIVNSRDVVQITAPLDKRRRQFHGKIRKVKGREPVDET